MVESSTQEADVNSPTAQPEAGYHRFNLLASPKEIQATVEAEYPESKGKKTTPYIASQSLRLLDEAERDAVSDFTVLRIRANRSVLTDERSLRMFAPDPDIQYYLRRSREVTNEELALAYDRDEAELNSSLTDEFAAEKLIRQLDADELHYDLPVNNYAVFVENPDLEHLGRLIHIASHGVDPGDAYRGPLVLVFSPHTLRRDRADDKLIYKQVERLHDAETYWSTEGLNWNRNILDLKQIYSAGSWADTPESKKVVPDPRGGADFSLRQIENVIFRATPGEYERYGFADTVPVAELVREVFGDARTGYRLYEWTDYTGWYQSSVVR